MIKSLWEKGISSKSSSSNAYYEFGLSLASISSFVLLVPIALVFLLFLSKISLSPFIFIPGIILGLFVSFYLAQDKKSFLLALIVFLSVVFISGFLLSNTVDLSHDSLSYHTKIVFTALCVFVMALNTGLVLFAVTGETKTRFETRSSLESYFDTKQPNHHRFDPDTEEQVKEGLRRTLKELGLNAEEHPSLIPIDGMIFVEEQTGEQFQRFIFEDDPPNDNPHPDTTWEHVTPAQSLFIRR